MSLVSDPLFDPAVVDDPHAYFTQLRETDPVHELPGTGAYLVTRMALIHEVVANPVLYSSHSSVFLHVDAGGPPSLLPPASSLEGYGSAVLATADPPDHARQRKVVARHLSATAMQAMEPEFRHLVDERLDAALLAGRMEWMGEVAEPLPMVMVTRILGLPDEVAPRLKDQGFASVERIGGFVTEARLHELDAGMADLAPLIDAYRAARSSHRGDPVSLIEVCARAVEDGELDDAEAVSTLVLVVAAGGESTTSLTGTGVRILAEQSDLQERLRAQPQLIPAFVEEACRFDPPFRGHYRHVTTDTTLGGVPLPAGATLILVWTAANRDPRAFSTPDEIDLDRPNPRQHVGFGWGLHLCVGAALARVEARVAFEQLLGRTASFRIDPSGPSLRYHRSLMIRRLIALPLLLEARS